MILINAPCILETFHTLKAIMDQNYLPLPKVMMFVRQQVKTLSPLVGDVFKLCAFMGQEKNVSRAEIEDALMRDLMHITLANPTDFYVPCIESVCQFWALKVRSCKEHATVGLKEMVSLDLEKLFDFKQSEKIYIQTKEYLEKLEQDFMKVAQEPVKTSHTLDYLKKLRSPVTVENETNYLNQTTVITETKINELADKLFNISKPKK